MTSLFFYVIIIYIVKIKVFPNEKIFMSEDAENEKKEIEIVTGDGSELEFSPVYEHLNAVKPKTKDEEEKKKKIIIPEVKKDKES